MNKAERFETFLRIILRRELNSEEIELLIDDDKFELVLEEIEKLELLTPREYEVIYRRFYEGRTLEEVGQFIYVTRERVRQIEYKALHKLERNKYVEEIVLYGYQSYEDRKHIERQQMEIKILNAEIEERKIEINRLIEKYGMLHKYVKEETESEGKVVPLRELNLSQRSYHYLSKYCISNNLEETTEIFFNMKLKDLANIKNIGAISCENILFELHSRGIYLADEKN